MSPGYLASTPKSLNSFGSISTKSLSISEHSESKNSMLCVFLMSTPFVIKNRMYIKSRSNLEREMSNPVGLGVSLYNAE